MREPFETPEMEIITFAGKDIILTSDPTEPYETPPYIDIDE